MEENAPRAEIGRDHTSRSLFKICGYLETSRQLSAFFNYPLTVSSVVRKKPGIVSLPMTRFHSTENFLTFSIFDIWLLHKPLWGNKIHGLWIGSCHCPVFPQHQVEILRWAYTTLCRTLFGRHWHLSTYFAEISIWDAKCSIRYINKEDMF